MAWEHDAKPGSSVGGCEGVICGSGSLYEEDGEDLDDDDDELEVVRLGGRSPSGSSRARTVGRSGVKPGCLWGDCDDWPGVSAGGGSSTRMCVAVRSSAAVGMAPRSTYREPAMF